MPASVSITVLSRSHFFFSVISITTNTSHYNPHKISNFPHTYTHMQARRQRQQRTHIHTHTLTHTVSVLSSYTHTQHAGSKQINTKHRQPSFTAPHTSLFHCSLRSISVGWWVHPQFRTFVNRVQAARRYTHSVLQYLWNWLSDCVPSLLCPFCVVLVSP